MQCFKEVLSMANVLGKGEKIFQVIIHICLVLLAACAIIPVWVLVSGSITGEQELILKGYSFFPKSLSADAYKYLFYKASEILRAYGITVLITVVGTSASLLITPLLAYPLSRKDFRARNVFAFLVFLPCFLMAVLYRLISCGHRFSYEKYNQRFDIAGTSDERFSCYSHEKLFCPEYSRGAY